jgi:nucleotide-binding universal stress UspA family protein
MYDRILVPTDGSTGTAHVVLQALDLAGKYGATVHTIHVIDDNTSSFLSNLDRDTDKLEERAEKSVSTVEQMAESHDIDCVTSIQEGNPAGAILQYADEIDADLIVAGTHGRSGVKRHLIGSVAERLVRHAECPVMTVRLPDTNVTVESVEQARQLITDALEREGFETELETIERQLSVWVATVNPDDGHVVVYLDPETQRTSVLEQSH